MFFLHAALLNVANQFFALTPDACGDPMFDRKHIISYMYVEPLSDEGNGMEYILPRDFCDVIVSLFIVTGDQEPVEMQVHIGGVIADTYIVESNKFQMGVTQGHMIPMVSLGFHQVELRFDKPIRRVYAVGAYLDTDSRRMLCLGHHNIMMHDEADHEEDRMVHEYRHGMCQPNVRRNAAQIMFSKVLFPSVQRIFCYGAEAFERVDMFTKPLFTSATMPDYFATTRLSWSTIRQRLDVYREELMQVAWHPNRFMVWCLACE
jgi:hypothetical protein